MNNTDHIVIRDGRFECHHCLECYQVGYPISIRLLSGFAGAFAHIHRDCKPANATHEKGAPGADRPTEVIDEQLP